MTMTARDKEIKALENAVQSNLAKANEAVGRANDYFVAAGTHLKELKAKKPSARPWYQYVEERFGLSRSRADELISIANGNTTIEKTRAKKAASVRKSRQSNTSDPPLRSGGMEVSEDGSIPFDKYQRADGQVKSACDFNGEDPEDVKEKHDTPADIRHRIFMHHAREAIRHAQENGFDKANKREITEEIIEMARQAAQAWTRVANDLKQKKNGEQKYG